MGALKNPWGWLSFSWHLETHQLIEVKRRHKRTVWMNLYENKTAGGHKTKDDADCHAGDLRIACIKVELDFEEGEGL